MKITAEFVTSAAGASDFPADGMPEIALVGRSNVGKSSLINALVRRRLARTSGAPGKTRLVNVYRVVRGESQPLYLVDLPGYGFARGGSADFEELAGAYFGRVGEVGRVGGNAIQSPDLPDRPHLPDPTIAAVLLVDARHPGLESDRAAWQWMQGAVAHSAIVATKVDKLARGERIRALRKLESVYEHPVLPVSAVTGEGLDELWKLIDRLAKRNSSSRRSSPNRLQKATAPPPPKKSSASTSRRSKT